MLGSFLGLVLGLADADRSRGTSTGTPSWTKRTASTSGCASADSSAVDLLLSVRDAARRDGVVLVLVLASCPVRRLLRLLELDEAFALG